MIRFFRHSGPLQLGILFLLIWLFRLPLFFTDAPWLWEDVKHLALGEKLSEGFLMYRDVIDSTPPFAALIYSFINMIFGKSLTAFYIIATLLVFVQSQQFKWLCNNNDILTEKGDLAALMYSIVAITCFDFLSLSPAFLSITFILIALNSVFKHLKSENNEGEIFTTGIFLGLAYLTFAPSAIYFIMSYGSFLLLTRTRVRYYFLFITGFVLPLLFCLTFFYLYDGLSEFINYYLFRFPADVGFKEDFNWKILMYLAIPSALLTFVGVIRALTYRRFIIYQAIIQRTMVLWLLVSFAVLTLFFNNITSAFALLIPFVAFFVTHFFQLISRKKLGGFVLMIFILYSLRSIYSYIDLPYLNKNLIDFNHQVSQENHINKKFEGKRIWSTGDNVDFYRNNRIATCYFDWEMSGPIVLNTNYYENINHIYYHFKIDMPEVIIDENNVMPHIFERIPYLKNSYKLAEKGIYLRK